MDLKHGKWDHDTYGWIYVRTTWTYYIKLFFFTYCTLIYITYFYICVFIYIYWPPNKRRPSKPLCLSLAMHAARQSMFNDLSLDNDVTLISFLRRPHLILTLKFWKLEIIRYDPRNNLNWSDKIRWWHRCLSMFLWFIDS